MTEAVENIALCYVDEGRPWFRRYTDLDQAFAEIEAESDCYVKYYRASFLARELGFEDKYRIYADLRDREKARIAAIVSV